ncbi:MAG: 2OG-Fe(II) oxygenase [Pseudomonadales bacterium]
MQFIAPGEIGIIVLDNFLNNEEVEDALSFLNEMYESDVCGEDGKGVKTKQRTGQLKFVSHYKSRMFNGVCHRIAQYLGTDLSRAEQAQFLKYGKGQKYEPHYDAFDKRNENEWKHYAANGGQRIYTAMVYLNDVHDGGTTLFPKLGIDIQPRKGRLLVWKNVGEDLTVPHPDSLHGGMPVGKKTEKICFTLWFRENPTTS